MSCVPRLYFARLPPQFATCAAKISGAFASNSGFHHPMPEKVFSGRNLPYGFEVRFAFGNRKGVTFTALRSCTAIHWQPHICAVVLAALKREEGRKIGVIRC